MKKVMIISSSPRIDGNSDLLAQEFLKGALDAGHDAELINIAKLNLGYCKACCACEKLGKCIQNDGLNEISEKLVLADVIVFATPVYFYSMSGQLKVFIDRLMPVYTQIHADIYMIMTAWEPNVKNYDSTIASIRGCTRDCFEDCEEKGILIAPDTYEKGAIKNHPEYLAKAYEMGKNC